MFCSEAGGGVQQPVAQDFRFGLGSRNKPDNWVAS
jgi:hypothetical protein